MKDRYHKEAAERLRSHPRWVRGLKVPGRCVYAYSRWSHPRWVRGLKEELINFADNEGVMSHPRWVRGLKVPAGG